VFLTADQLIAELREAGFEPDPAAPSRAQPAAAGDGAHGRRAGHLRRRFYPQVMQMAMIPPSETLNLADLITPTAHGIASRVLAKTGGGNVTLFAFDAGEGLSEHTTACDALVIVLEGELTLTIGGTPLSAVPGTIVRMPANVPHAVDAPMASRMLLIMLREPKAS
jgi:quercetin dioxygenase-like cupin family protein